MTLLQNYLHRTMSFSDNARHFLLSITLNFISLGAIQVILGLYIINLGFSEDFFGLVVGTRILATGIMAIPAGILTRKFGTKNLLLMASILAGFATIIQGLFPHQYLLILMNFIYGTAFAIFFVSIGPFLSNNSSSKQRKELFSVNYTLMIVARMIGSFLVGILPSFFIYIFPGVQQTNTLTYKYVLLILGVISLLALWPTGLIQGSSYGSHGQQNNLQIWQGLKEKNISRLSLYQFLLGAGGGLIAPFFSIFLAQHLGATTGQAGMILFVYRITMAVAVLLTPFLIKKIGRIKSVGLVQVGSLPFLLAIVLIPNFALASAAFLIRGALMSMTRPIASNFAMEITPGGRKTLTSSIMRTSKSIARSLSASAAGWIISRYGFKPTYFMTFVLYLTAAFFFVRSFHKHEHGQHKQQQKQAA